MHELVRQDKRGLEIVKTAGAYDVDLLCGTGCAAAVAAGFVGFETAFGMAPSYRRSVEQGRVEAKEHACYTVIAGMRAAIQGVPFMPVAGMTGSDVLAARGFRTIADPYGGAEVVAVPALTPDVAIIHVHEADAAGNARIVGTRFEDVLMAQAARRVILTAERLVDGETFEAAPETVAIPGFLVDAVVEVPARRLALLLRRTVRLRRRVPGRLPRRQRDPEDFRRFVEERVLGAALAVGA